MGASGRIAGKSRGPQRWRSALQALEAARVGVFAALKKGAEEADFPVSGRKLIHAVGLRQSYSDRCIHNNVLRLRRADVLGVGSI